MGETEDKAAKAALGQLLLQLVALFGAPALLVMLGWIGHSIIDTGQLVVSLGDNISALRSEVQTTEGRAERQIGGIVNVQEELQREVARLQEAEAQREREDAKARPRLAEPN